jgi:hypothetical protein
MAEPRRIAAAINDVSVEIGRWSAMATSAKDESDSIIRFGSEHVHRTEHSTAIAADLLGQQTLLVQKVRLSADRSVESADDAVERVEVQRDANLRLHAFVSATLVAWTNELREAMAWKARAEARVSKAEAWVARATREVSSCKSAVSSAESSLRRCNNDKERKNCNSEARSLANAENNLAAAYRDLQRAQIELAQARVELAHAVARVNCCTSAVKLAVNAEQLCVESAEQIKDASHMASLGLADARRSAESAGRAEQFLAAEDEAVEQMRSLAVRSRRLLDEALTHQRSSQDGYQTSQRYSKDAQRDLALRVERLREFDRGGL